MPQRIVLMDTFIIFFDRRCGVSNLIMNGENSALFIFRPKRLTISLKKLQKNRLRCMPAPGFRVTHVESFNRTLYLDTSPARRVPGCG